MRDGVRIVLLVSALFGGWHSSATAEKFSPLFQDDLLCRQAATDTLSRLYRQHSGDKLSMGIQTPSDIVIIIDDLGYSLKRGRLAVELPGAVTVAVLPHSPHGRNLAEMAHHQNKEVMMHAPMSNLSGRALDEGGLTSAMDRRTFTAVLRENLRAVPHVSGVNNHMGSLLTQEKRPMQWLMGELKVRQLYFVDSRTSPDSLAGEIAREQGLPNLERNFFLDNERDCQGIARQFTLFLAQAKRIGHSVAIAHPYPETLQFLHAILPALAEAGIRLVPASHLLDPASSPRRALDGPADYIGRLR